MSAGRVFAWLGLWFAISAIVWLGYAGILLFIEDGRHQRASLLAFHNTGWVAIPILGTFGACIISAVLARAAVDEP